MEDDDSYHSDSSAGTDHRVPNLKTEDTDSESVAMVDASVIQVKNKRIRDLEGELFRIRKENELLKQQQQQKQAIDNAGRDSVVLWYKSVMKNFSEHQKFVETTSSCSETYGEKLEMLLLTVKWSEEAKQTFPNYAESMDAAFSKMEHDREISRKKRAQKKSQQQEQQEQTDQINTIAPPKRQYKKRKATPVVDGETL